ncbi:mismatch-specific DNA-glycosylase [soil metagenome]
MGCDLSKIKDVQLFILPDHLRPDLAILFCGTAVSVHSAERGHFYNGPGNEFWRFLHESGITPIRFKPEDDHRICEFECGLTDLVKTFASNSDAGLRRHYDVTGFLKKIEPFKPKWVAFHGKEAAKIVAKHFGLKEPLRLGRQSWMIGSSSVFVLPSASGANRNVGRCEGKADRIEWFKELALAAWN